MTDLPTWLMVVFGIIGAANVLGSAYAVYRGSANKARASEQHDHITELQGQVAALATANQAVERVLDFERTEHAKENKKCEVEVARLTGQVQTLQDSVVVGLVESIKVAVQAALQEVLGRSERT